MFAYPNVSRGDTVDFAHNPDVPDMQWMTGEVQRTKHGSCDLWVRSLNRMFADVRHADDPSVRDPKRPIRPDSGVFRLTKQTQDVAKCLAEVTSLRMEISSLRQAMRVASGNSNSTMPEGKISGRTFAEAGT